MAELTINHIAYLYPNDEQELDRLDMQHHMFKLINEGRLFFAPVENPQRILDIGTGSGIWPMEMGMLPPLLLLMFSREHPFLRIPLASIFPQAEIVGTDLSPVQPTEVPENVHFLVDDATEDDWLWEHDHFDFIHISHLSGSLPSYKALLRKAMRHLKPGGYIECHELDPMPRCDDGTMPPENPDGFCDYALHDWFDLNVRSGQVSDPPRQFRVAPRMTRFMNDLGFVDLQTRKTMLPTNSWPSDPHLKNIGSWSETNWLEALSGWSYKPLMILGWSKPEIEVFLVEVRRCIQNRDIHSYTEYHVVTGRKPLPGEQGS